MVASVVFIFLLDHLPDHPQHSLYTNQSYEYQHSITKVQQCDTHIADRLVQYASKELNTFLIPHWRYNEEKLVMLLGNLSANAHSNGLEIGNSDNMEENMSTIEFNHFIEDELTSQMIDDTSDCDDEFKTNNKDKLIGSTFINEFSERDAANVINQGSKNYSAFENNDIQNKTINSSDIGSFGTIYSKINYSNGTRINNTSNDNASGTDDIHKYAVIGINENLILNTPKYTSNLNGFKVNDDISANATNNNEIHVNSTNFQTSSEDHKVIPLKKDHVRLSNIKPIVNNVNIDDIRTIDKIAITNTTRKYNTEISIKNYINTSIHDVVVFANDTSIKSETEMDKTTLRSIIDDENEEYRTTIPSENKTKQNLNNTELTTEKEFVKVFPPRVPYLVAMFETVSNVTAQTCGGTLVAPEWVLTAASCVNVLQNLLNRTDLKEKTTYTVIVNATNPLLDGSAFNVTEILLHPQTPASIGSKIVKEKRPVLALLRIEPKANIEEVLIKESVIEDVNVMVYGWVLVKNESGHDVMHAASFPATTLSPLQCRVRHGLTDDSALCLDTKDPDNGTFSQMTSGSPVVLLTDEGPRLLALAVTDARTPLLAAPLHAHARWMRSILRPQAVL